MLSWIIPAVGGNTKDDVSKFTFGAEWGYSAAFHYGSHCNYFDPVEGFRIDSSEGGFCLHPQAEVYLHAGYNFNTRWNLSAYAGITGVGSYHNAIPISIRATRYFGDNALNDRWFAFGDIGSGISIKSTPQEIAAFKIGGGYRLSLSRCAKLDFLAALRLIYTHPDIIHYGDIVELTYINHNVAYVCSLSFGISLTF